MRTILRVGITVGGVAFVVLYPLQSIIGLAVTPGIVVAGLFAGLGTAKWLERSWFGRQFDAGLRAGVIAAGMAGGSVLLASFMQGARSTGQITSSAHLFGFDLGPLIAHLAPMGWAGIDILVVGLATGAGIVLAIVTTELGALGKNRHALQVVNQARLAARAEVPGEPSPIASAPVPAAAGIHNLRTVPTPPPGTLAPMRASGFGGQADAAALVRASGAGGRMATPPPVTPPVTPPSNHRLIPPEPDPERFQETEPVLRTPGRRSSKVRPADSQLTEAMREALATWASDSVSSSRQDSPEETPAAPGTPDPRTRAPQPSAYLNSSPPVSSKRARKKQNTEWIR